MSVNITGRKTTVLFAMVKVTEVVQRRWQHIKVHSVEKHIIRYLRKGLEHMAVGYTSYMPVANMLHFSLFNDGINKGILFVLT